MTEFNRIFDVNDETEREEEYGEEYEQEVVIRRLKRAGTLTELLEEVFQNDLGEQYYYFFQDMCRTSKDEPYPDHFSEYTYPYNHFVVDNELLPYKELLLFFKDHHWTKQDVYREDYARCFRWHKQLMEESFEDFFFYNQDLFESPIYFDSYFDRLTGEVCKK